jgi:N-terminal domain of NWD NACHT-NTPase
MFSAEHLPLAHAIAPPAPTASCAQATPSLTVDPSPPNQPEQLWDQAYDDLKADEPKLVELYETILSTELDGSSKEDKANVIEQTDQTKRLFQMGSLLNTGLDKIEKLSKVKKNIGDAINIVLSVKEAIGNGLQAVPIAALAWAGVCVALQASLPS